MRIAAAFTILLALILGCSGGNKPNAQSTAIAQSVGNGSAICVGALTQPLCVGATPPSAYAKYSPLMAYTTNLSGGAGGDYCSVTAPVKCATPAVMQAIGGYYEGLLNDPVWDEATGTSGGVGPDCPSAQPNCIPVAYMSFPLMHCDQSPESTIIGLLGESDFLHRIDYPSTRIFDLSGGTNAKCSYPPYGAHGVTLFPNPGSTLFRATVIAQYFTSASYLNSRHSYGVYMDNFFPQCAPASNAVYPTPLPSPLPTTYPLSTEYGSTRPTCLAYLDAESGLLNAIGNYPLVVNYLGPGGGHYGLCGATCQTDNAHFVPTTGSTAYSLPASRICDNDSQQNARAFTSERALASGGLAGTATWNGNQNANIVANSVASFWADPNCSKTSIIDLEPSTASSANGFTAQRETALAYRALLTPPGYGGGKGERSAGSWFYYQTQPSGCTSTCPPPIYLPVFPEQMALPVAPQLNLSSPAYKYGGTGNGDGCYASTVGGITNLTAPGSCTGVDWSGYTAGVWYQCGLHWIVYGVDKGVWCTFLNDRTNNYNIPDSLCFNLVGVNCSAMVQVAPTGNEQQYLGDNIANGTINAGSNGAYGTTAYSATVGVCETPASAWVTPCGKTIQQNP